ncbi:MAG: hypothetical protein V4627_10355 [Pseudomonadota bacterium]
MTRTFSFLAIPFLTIALQALAPAAVAAPVGPDVSRLLASHSEFQPQLKAKALGEPLHLVSQDTGSRLNADVYAEVPQPFKPLSSLLSSPDSVCGVMFLHLNVRACKATRNAQGDGLVLSAGPKQGSNGGAVYTMQYTMRVEASTPDYVRVALTAASGPLSTSDYRIVFEATPLEGQRTFLRFGYSYSYGSMAKMAMGLYLSTAGRSKIGFTVVGTGADGKPKHVQGERGSIERNVIRNYLALLAYTSIPGAVGQPQMDARLRAWFALSERYAPQLHELTLDEYLTQKHEDLAHPQVATR